MNNASGSIVHVAFVPSAGLGHLTPCLRLAALFLRHQYCHVTLITPKPTVSLAESHLISRFCSSFPDQVSQIDLHLLPFDPTSENSSDPFWLHFERIRRSLHLLAPILSSLTPPLSAFVYDVSLISGMIPVSESLAVPSYIYFIATARMFSFFSHLSVLDAAKKHAGGHPASFIGDAVEIPGIHLPVPRSSIPPLLLVPGSLFEKIFMEDSPRLTKLDGIFINTFEEMEEEAVAALNAGKVVPGLPPVHAVGPLMPCEFEKEQDQDMSANSPLKWLDAQPEGSVVYVCFGNRTATTREQLKEMAEGLLRSGYRFLWVVKLKMVDKEDDEDLEQVLEPEVMKKMKEKGLVVKTWVNQGEILGHTSVGGFLSHGGWNSIVESIWHGVPILSWGQNGDQKITSEVVAESGTGVWPVEWGWGGEAVVKAEEIGKAVREIMSSESLKARALQLKEAARKAAGVGGSCEVKIRTMIEKWKKKNVVY
ncbi:UDP-glycosyltransferase 708D1-like [Prosopis cineraria]|uniref:UDP-glycosyltransferase 708D1-like n=1 Tax=Prosopis cineraria TaxID=364024 RepID=UPI00240F7CDA|nr:UDP-glycosyltransferase 708D1-like [Prosopis cineraria]